MSIVCYLLDMVKETVQNNKTRRDAGMLRNETVRNTLQQERTVVTEEQRLNWFEHVSSMGIVRLPTNLLCSGLMDVGLDP